MTFPSTSESINESFNLALRQHLRFYDKTKINWIELPKEHCEFIAMGTGIGAAVRIRQYADYITLEATDNLEEKAKVIGLMCASVYNCLMLSATHEFGFGLSAVDLFENNLKFNYVINTEPSVADPAATIYGWMSYRFKFAAGIAK